MRQQKGQHMEAIELCNKAMARTCERGRGRGWGEGGATEGAAHGCD